MPTPSEVAKARDAWFTVVCVDRLALPLTGFCARFSSITPNRVTIAALALRVAAVGAMATGNTLVAVAIWFVAFVPDCVDGKLARLRGQASRFGAALDQWGDLVTDWAFFVTAAYILFLPDSPLYLWITVLWLSLWTSGWLTGVSEAQEVSMAPTDADTGHVGKLKHRYYIWTSRHRLKLWAVSAVEELHLIVPLAIATRTMASVVAILAVYRALITLARLTRLKARL